jgi:hypothetical protein
VDDGGILAGWKWRLASDGQDIQIRQATSLMVDGSRMGNILNEIRRRILFRHEGDLFGLDLGNLAGQDRLGYSFLLMLRWIALDT